MTEWHPLQDLADRPPVCDLVQDLEAIAAAARAWRLAHLGEDVKPASRWHVVGWRATGRGGSRAGAWECPLLMGARLVVQHCGHPTALRPYYVPGLLQQLGTFPRLAQAQACAEAVLLPAFHVKHGQC